MYVRVSGLGQPIAAVPQQPGPWGPPVPMPNPLMPTPAPIPSASIALVLSGLQCSDAQLAAIRAVVGTGVAVTGDTVAFAVGHAHNGIWVDLTDPDNAPRSELLKPEPTLNAVRLFTEAFGAAPGDLPWRGARWNLGRIVATRLGGARKTMFSSSVRISCWGWPWPGGGVDRPLGYMVKALPKQERVALGALFWKSGPTSGPVSRAAGMLAAGLVIRYGVSYRAQSPPLGNLHCYLKYAITMLGHPVPQWVSDKCSPVV